MAGQGCHRDIGHEAPREEGRKTLQVPPPFVLVQEPLHQMLQAKEEGKAQALAGLTHCEPPDLGKGAECQ
eukprot:11182783-Lingulodinium_polyedra.AAC.1